MRFRGKAEEAETREDIGEMAEALGLFGSAMRHMADRRAEQMGMQTQTAEMRRERPLRLRLVLAPVLGAAVTVAVAIPAWSHFHEGDNAARKQTPAVETSTETRASVNDTVLMNQIDSDVSEDVPDALEPLAQLGEQAAATKTTVSEKNNASQE